MTTVPLRRVSVVIAGQSPPSDEVRDLAEGLPFVQGNAEFTDQFPVPRLQCDSPPKRARRGDLLLSVRAPVGAMNWSEGDLGIGRGLAALRPSGEWDARFLAYGLRASMAALRSSAAGSTFEAVTSDALGSLELPAIGAHAQRRIADFLDDRVARIDQIIAARRTQLESLKPFRRTAVLSSLAGLARVSLRRLLRGIVTGGTPGPEADVARGLSWYSPSAFRPDLVLGDPSRCVSRDAAVSFRPQSVLIVGIGATAGKVCWLSDPGSGNQQLTCLEHDPSRVHGRFLLHQLDAMREDILNQAPSSTLPIINNEFIKDLGVAAPSLPEQHALAAAWDERLVHEAHTVSLLNRSIGLLMEYKHSLITAAVSGELDVTTAGRTSPQ